MFDIQEQTQRARGFLGEFRAFAFKSNVVDLAVAVIIGAAFSRIITSLVKDILMPLVGLILGGVPISHYTITLRKAYTDAAGLAHQSLELHIGSFIQSLLDFLIIAWCLFLIIKAVGKLQAILITHEKIDAEKEKRATQAERDVMRQIAADIATIRESVTKKS